MAAASADNTVTSTPLTVKLDGVTCMLNGLAGASIIPLLLLKLNYKILK